MRTTSRRTPGSQVTTPAKESASRPVGQQPAPPDDPRQDELYVRIAKRAYEMYLRRGSHEGHALEDWLEAGRSTRRAQVQGHLQAIEAALSLDNSKARLEANLNRRSLVRVSRLPNTRSFIHS